jgi:hypothetical protein
MSPVDSTSTTSSRFRFRDSLLAIKKLKFCRQQGRNKNKVVKTKIFFFKGLLERREGSGKARVEVFSKERKLGPRRSEKMVRADFLIFGRDWKIGTRANFFSEDKLPFENWHI